MFIIKDTRSYAALWAADLDWIVESEYSLGEKEEGVQGRNKQKRDKCRVTTDQGRGGRAGINKNVTHAGSQLTF